MKPFIVFAAIVALAAIPTLATAQASPKAQGPARNRTKEVGGVETIKPQEAARLPGVADANGWNGPYVGVNAGGSFGATAGSNVVVPFGTSGQSEK